MQIENIQKELRKMGVDGWLFYDFHGRDHIAARILKIPSGHMATRRWFYFIPSEGSPIKLNHKIEPNYLNHLPGEKELYLPWQDGYKFANDDEKELSKKFVRKFGLYSALLIPLIYAFQIVSIPNNALSGLMFVFGLLSLLFVVFFAQSIYLTKSSEHASGVKYGFMFIMISFAMFAAQDQQAFHISIAENLNNISEIHNKAEEERQALYAKSEEEPQVDAQAIFDTRCVACHKFDTKSVGPAYNDVVPKYEGKEGDLVKFILNPTPQNPAEYPAGMPAQGLSPAEGKALAKWLLDKVLGGGEKEAEPAAEKPAEEQTATK